MSGHDDPDAVELVGVTVGGREVAVEAGRIAEVTERPEPTRVPGADDAVEGVVEVDGAVTAVVDGAALFGADRGEAPGAGAPPGVAGRAVVDEASEATGPDRLVVFDRGPGADGVGLRVDRVGEVAVVPVAELVRDPAPDRLPAGVDPALVAAVVAGEDGRDRPVVDVAAVSSLAE
jgi:chemotaxis signal transduction protein